MTSVAFYLSEIPGSKGGEYKPVLVGDLGRIVYVRTDASDPPAPRSHEQVIGTLVLHA